jgi:membrane protease YdiL (CAAX protease family)
MSPPPPPRLSQWATLVYALLWALLLADGASDRLTGSPLDLLSDPVRAGTRLASRDLRAAEGAEGAGAPERWLWGQLQATPREALEAGVGIHEDLLRYLESTPSDPGERERARLRLALWLAAAGDPDQAVAVAERSGDRPELGERLHQLLASGTDPGPDFWVRASRAAPRLAAGLRADEALRAGDGELARSLETELAAGARTRYARSRWPLVATAGLVALGVAALLSLSLLPRARGHGASPWSLALGLAVFVRGDFWNRLYFSLLSRLPAEAWQTLPIDLLWSWGSLFASLPLAWLAYRILFLPHRDAQPRPFGLLARGPGAARLVAVGLAALAIDLVGAYALSWGAWELGLHGHWSEGFDEILVFGAPSQALAAAIDYGLWTPIFEELAFRGVLFFSLRRALGPTRAALASALVFGAVHFYSLPGFAATLWSGFVWALAYERARSLLPGIAAHSLYNLLYVAGQIALYR